MSVFDIIKMFKTTNYNNCCFANKDIQYPVHVSRDFHGFFASSIISSLSKIDFNERTGVKLKSNLKCWIEEVVGRDKGDRRCLGDRQGRGKGSPSPRFYLNIFLSVV